jgi:peptidylprolyl isomerase
MGKLSIIVLVIAVLLVGAVVLLGRSSTQDKTGDEPVVVFTPSDQSSPSADKQSLPPEAAPSSQKEQYSASPAMQINVNKKYTAIFDTSEGTISVQLNPKTTPTTVNNFVFLATKHFYDNTIFHRVLEGFMIQGGDPKGDGTGGPGYRFNDEKFSGEYSRGTLAMANAGPNTNGSQFFIMQKDNPSLPKNYVIFGNVVSGIDVVDKIASVPVGPNEMGEQSKPLQPVKLNSVNIVVK